MENSAVIESGCQWLLGKTGQDLPITKATVLNWHWNHLITRVTLGFESIEFHQLKSTFSQGQKPLSPWFHCRLNIQGWKIAVRGSFSYLLSVYLTEKGSLTNRKQIPLPSSIFKLKQAIKTMLKVATVYSTSSSKFQFLCKNSVLSSY